jgi:hypothetical protein
VGINAEWAQGGGLEAVVDSLYAVPQERWLAFPRHSNLARLTREANVALADLDFAAQGSGHQR